MKLLVAALLFYWTGYGTDSVVHIGSKKFTESVILGEVLSLLAKTEGVRAVHHEELGGTRILWNALLSGDIDIYVEYTGTLIEELLPRTHRRSLDDADRWLHNNGVLRSHSLGFNNTYAIGLKKNLASEKRLKKLSDLTAQPDIRLGFSNEFRKRSDGWPRLQRVYGLEQIPVGLDHDIAYRALQSGDIEATDLYSTDAEIAYYDLAILEDDRNAFPKYEAILLYRADLQTRMPNLVERFRTLENRIAESTMIAMNARAKISQVAASRVAGDFLSQKMGVQTVTHEDTLAQRIFYRLKEHVRLVFISLMLAISIAIPSGILAAKFPGLGRAILSTVGIIQTFPALALLVLLIRPLKSMGLQGIGETPAIVALTLYSLLPILRNTYTGLQTISIPLRESAEALGLSTIQRLRYIELPLATPSILAGIQTAAVVNVGFATLGALVGAGGFGQPILAGIRLDNYALILEGAVPAAVLAVATQSFFELCERLLIPTPLRP